MNKVRPGDTVADRSLQEMQTRLAREQASKVIKQCGFNPDDFEITVQADEQATWSGRSYVFNRKYCVEHRATERLLSYPASRDWLYDLERDLKHGAFGIHPPSDD